MYIKAKVFSSILCQRLLRIFNKHGVKYQFVSTLGVGFQYITFNINILIQVRNNHKEFDTVKYDLVMDILEQYGDPPII